MLDARFMEQVIETAFEKTRLAKWRDQAESTLYVTRLANLFSLHAQSRIVRAISTQMLKSYWSCRPTSDTIRSVPSKSSPPILYTRSVWRFNKNSTRFHLAKKCFLVTRGAQSVQIADTELRHSFVKAHEPEAARNVHESRAAT
jgi:hypothetical protein